MDLVTCIGLLRRDSSPACSRSKPEKLDYATHRPDPRRGAEPIAGDGSHLVAERRLRSAAHRLAGDSTGERLGDRRSSREWGLANAHQERWKFGKGWSLVRFNAHLIEPQIQPLIGFPQEWSPGTKGHGHRRRGPRADRQRGGLREISRQARGQDRADAAGAPRAPARRADRPAHGRQVDSPRPRRRRCRPRVARREREERRARMPAAARRRPRRRTGVPQKLAEFLAAEGVVAIFDRGSDSDMAAGGSDLSVAAAASGRRDDLSRRQRRARRERRQGRAARHAGRRALQPHDPRARQGPAGEGRAERRDEVLRRDDA